MNGQLHCLWSRGQEPGFTYFGVHCNFCQGMEVPSVRRCRMLLL